MKKQLVYKNDAYYYQFIDAEDGTPIYDGDDAELKYREENNIPYTTLNNWEYDDFLAQEDFENLLNTLDDEKYNDSEARRFAKVKIYPNLGLWDGRHKCEPEEEDDFSDAIKRCLGRDIEDFEIYMAGKWTVYIDAHHHDGTNHFKLTCYI